MRLEPLLETLKLRLDTLVAAPAAPALVGLACVKRQWPCQPPTLSQTLALSNSHPLAIPLRTTLLDKAVKLRSNPYGAAAAGLAL